MDCSEQTTTLALETLGCKLNQAETESLARQFSRAGYELVEAGEGADVYVLNTCTVTHVADRKSRHLLRLARRRNPHAFVVAIGCYAQRAGEELAGMSEVDLAIGSVDKERLVQIVEAKTGKESGWRLASDHRGSRTRALVKIQDGCSQSCSYCIVPIVRGRERSLPVKQVVAAIQARVAEGHKEIVLTGPQIGRYGQDNGRSEESTLRRLVHCILAETEVQRLRLSSLQPQDLTPALIELWADERLCPHFHIALQSGSDTVLRRMGRRYSTADYERAVAMIREAVPEVAITTDLIVGFPGESEKEFEQSYRFCERMGFARMHVFAYSARPGTVASRMLDQIDERVKKQRSRKMLELAEVSAQRFQETYLGREAMVLWEGRREEDGIWSGLTGNYTRVYTRCLGELANKLLPARLICRYGQGLWAELMEQGGDTYGYSE